MSTIVTSETPQQAPRSLRVLTPWGVIIGAILGFLACILLGKQAARRDVHRDFTRFHPMIAPDTLYQPTLNEMIAVVRSRVPKDAILVIVGGNSIFYGVGQPARDMWTERLQRLLGSRYYVINFAFRGSSPADAGAVVAEVLRDEYPKLIYVTNTGAGQPIDPIGSDTYRFLFWEAYFKGLLLDDPGRETRLEDLFTHRIAPDQRQELKLQMQMDKYLHFRDLWQDVAFRRFFPVWNERMPTLRNAFAGRKAWKDEEGDYRTLTLQQRYNPAGIETELEIIRGSSRQWYVEESNGGWRKSSVAWDDFERWAKISFPDPLKARTLLMLSRHSPFYTRILSGPERARDERLFADTVELWKRHGYVSADYGQDFDPLDYGDRTHLAVSGGEKLAGIVAPLVKQMAADLGYLKP